MKSWILLSVLLWVFPARSILSQNMLIYSEVVPVDSVSKKDLYNRAMHWFVRYYQDAAKVLRLYNKEEGELVGKWIFRFDPTSVYNQSIRGNIEYTVKIFVRDGRYKFQVSDFIHLPEGSTGFGVITASQKAPVIPYETSKWANKVWNEMKEVIQHNIDALIPSLKRAMETPVESERTDW
jgi:hypothetical protein